MKLLLHAGLILVAHSGLNAAEPPSLYDRVAAKLEGRADLASLGQPPVELEQVSWMLGTWDIEVRVVGRDQVERGEAVISKVLGGCWLQMADSYPTGTQDLGFLTYNIVTRRWINGGVDSLGNSVKAEAVAWDGNRLVFEAPQAEIVGVVVSLRQILTKLSADEFTLRNEELLPDGSWRAVDEYHYRRRP